jgi:hypothetical protein
MNATTAGLPYPTALRHEVRLAARLSHALARMMDRVDPSDASFVWLVGRSDEIRAVVGVAVREWQEGRLDERRAAERVGGYVRGLYETLSALDRSPPSARPRCDTLVDD